MEKTTICCNVNCSEKFTCQKFSRALDVNSGKIKANYVEIKCEKFNEYEK